MMCNSEQVVSGILNYIDGEVIRNLPTSGKWLIGAGVGIAATKMNNIMQVLNSNQVIKTVGIIDENGMYDIDLIVDNLKTSANKYGKLMIQVPMIGKLTFTESDIDMLKKYIEME